MSSVLIRTYLLILLIFETIFLIIAIKSKNKKVFKIFNGLFFSFLISIIFYCTYFLSEIYTYDTGEFLEINELIISAIFCIINFIIGFIGLITQKICKQKNLLVATSKKGTTIKCILIVSLTSFIIIFSQYMIKYNEKNHIDNEVKQEAMNYLKEKYNTDNFKIGNIYRHFGANGAVGTNLLTEYNIPVIYVPDNIEFFITFYVDKERKILKDISYDYFIKNYIEHLFTNNDFTEGVNNEINTLTNFLKAHQMNVEIKGSTYYLITDTETQKYYGRIPSKIELYNDILNQCIKHNFTLEIPKTEIKGEDIELELKEYLKNLSNYLIDFYVILDDYKLNCNYNDNKGNNFTGTITINNEYININMGKIKEQIKR